MYISLARYFECALVRERELFKPEIFCVWMAQETDGQEQKEERADQVRSCWPRFWEYHVRGVWGMPTGHGPWAAGTQ